MTSSGALPCLAFLAGMTAAYAAATILATFEKNAADVALYAGATALAAIKVLWPFIMESHNVTHRLSTC